MTTVKSSGQSIDVSATITNETAPNPNEIERGADYIELQDLLHTQSTDTTGQEATFADQVSSAVAKRAESALSWTSDVANSTAEGAAADVKNTIQDAEAKILASNPFLSKLK